MRIKLDQKKLFASFIPKDIVKYTCAKFIFHDTGLIISPENWPSNLIYNENFLKSSEMFSEKLCCDTTLFFYVRSALGRCKSLVSRAVHEPDIIWEHGPIRVLEIYGECPEPWMTSTITEVAIWALNKNE